MMNAETGNEIAGRRPRRESPEPAEGGNGRTGASGVETTIVSQPEAIESEREDAGRRGIEAMCLIAAHLCRDGGHTLKSALRSVEKAVILDTLRQVNGCQRDASRMLGMNFTTLNYKLHNYGIRMERG